MLGGARRRPSGASPRLLVSPGYAGLISSIAGRSSACGAQAEWDPAKQLLVCPFCGTSRTELHSPFGSALSVATYWCMSCRTAFEWVKWGAVPAEGTEGTKDAENG